MDFDSIFGVTSTASKQFEARWFFDFPMENNTSNSGSSSVVGCDYDTTTNNHHDDDLDYDPIDPPCKVRVHRMPFQRRTLSYWIGIRYGSRRSARSRKYDYHGKQQGHATANATTTATPTKTGTTRSKHQKLDLLNTLWQHRVRNYNDAFLSSPRRNTRNYYAKINTPPLPSSLSVKRAIRSPISDKKQQQQPKTPTTTTTTTRASPGRETKKGSSSVSSSNMEENSIWFDSRDEWGPEQLNVTQNHLLVPDMANTSVDKTPPRSPVAVALVSESGNATALENSDHYRHQNNSTPVTEIEDTNDLLEWKKRLPNAEARQRESTDSKARVLFHFLFLNDEQNPCFLTDATPEDYDGHRRCIFCYFDGGSDAGLLMHCVTCHGQFLSFKAARSEDGTLHIAITKKVPSTSSSGPSSTGRDFVYVRRSKPCLAGCVASVPFVKRRPSKACSLDLQTRRKKMRLLVEAGADEETRLQFVPGSDMPVRQYFHSRSNEPMLPGEWDVDSDDEDDEGWLTIMSEQLMDEFDDVTPQEKRFTKLWNRFMKSHEVIADHAIPSKCFEFIRTHANFLIEHDLRDELMLHCMGFWDSGLISSTHLMTLMAEFDKVRNAHYSESNVAA